MFLKNDWNSGKQLHADQQEIIDVLTFLEKVSERQTKV